jgi:diaminopimelate decarboxylase
VPSPDHSRLLDPRLGLSATIADERPKASLLRQRCEGIPALPARLETWMVDALGDGRIGAALATFGSPINLLDVDPMRRNMVRLESIARQRGLNFRVYFARKSNKCLSFVDEALGADAGIDTASEQELRQALGRGAKSKDLICTAAIKQEPLLRLCGQHQVTVAVDNLDELSLVHSLAKPPPIALRWSGFYHEGRKLPSRFGFDVDEASSILDVLDALHRTSPGTSVQGFHFHLDGQDHGQRVSAIKQCLDLVTDFRRRNHPIGFLDMGGGFPVSYLDRQEPWDNFWIEHHRALAGHRPEITRGNHEIGDVYSSYHPLDLSEWFTQILDSTVERVPIFQWLDRYQLQLRCEPGRSLMDGCGMTIARVEFRKRTTSGDWIIGVAMNRTQCRTTSDDFLVDPIVIPGTNQGVDGRFQQDADDSCIEGYLAGAYCTEHEWLTWRKLRFPRGVRVGDMIAFPNTAGYMMHFMESRSHQFPLAKNVFWNNDSSKPFDLDLIDCP